MVAAAAVGAHVARWIWPFAAICFAVFFALSLSFQPLKADPLGTRRVFPMNWERELVGRKSARDLRVFQFF